MAVAVRFDTYHYAQILREAGVPEPQAEGMMRAQAFALEDSLPEVLVTREDLLQSENRLAGQIAATREDLLQTQQRLTGQIAAVDQQLTAQIADVDKRLTGQIADVDKRLSLGIAGLRDDFKRQLWLMAGVLSVVCAMALKLFLH